MIDCAYIQKKGGEFINETAFSFWQGCHLLGLETRPFEQEQLQHVQLTKECLVHGYVGTVRSALKALGVQEPHIDGLPPPALLPFYGRKCWATTMLEVRRGLETERIFIKPLNVQKAFNGHVTSGQISDLIQTAGFTDEFEVMASEVIDFVAEYRLFVGRGLIRGCRHYKGDFTEYPDFAVAYACVNAWTDAPVSYALDLGVTADGRTLVVEVNDFQSLGSYGLASIPYAEMVIDRWEQLVGIGEK